MDDQTSDIADFILVLNPANLLISANLGEAFALLSASKTANLSCSQSSTFRSVLSLGQ